MISDDYTDLAPQTFEHWVSRPRATGHKVLAPTKLTRAATYEPDRVCEHPDCTTKISIYNSQPKCFRHQPPKFPRVRGTDIINARRAQGKAKAKANQTQKEASNA